ncbi:MAG: lipopolysaccharide core heptose(I) kinase RfaP [Pseudomonadales bacterium]|nr:lipopolysaccharide core heptose(I) kinase RfaP [Pseudomonadales bacterium]
MKANELYLREDFRDAWQGKDPFACAQAIEGKVYRALENRRTLRFEFNGQAFFIKMHKGLAWPEIVKNLVQLRLPVASARNEWLALARLRELGIDAPTVVAYGNRGRLPATVESFLVTEDLGKVESLEDICQSWPAQPPAFAFKFALLQKVAWISQTLHAHGICHRDLYICHFLLRQDSGPGRFTLFLIDLHRALIKNNLGRRWVIKDVGSLYFSALAIGLSSRDRLRFIRWYSGKGLRQCLTEDRKFWLGVETRARRIAARESDKAKRQRAM